jgi:hypothetical protein
MTRAVRTLVLVVAVTCTLAVAAPVSVKLNNGPIPTCWNCK